MCFFRIRTRPEAARPKAGIRIFHSNRDADLVYPLVQELGRRGYCISAAGMHGQDGPDWPEPGKAVDDCALAIAVLSEHFFSTAGCTEELRYILERKADRIFLQTGEVSIPPEFSLCLPEGEPVRIDGMTPGEIADMLETRYRSRMEWMKPKYRMSEG